MNVSAILLFCVAVAFLVLAAYNLGWTVRDAKAKLEAEQQKARLADLETQLTQTREKAHASEAETEETEQELTIALGQVHELQSQVDKWATRKRDPKTGRFQKRTASTSQGSE